MIKFAEVIAKGFLRLLVITVVSIMANIKTGEPFPPVWVVVLIIILAVLVLGSDGSK